MVGGVYDGGGPMEREEGRIFGWRRGAGAVFIAEHGAKKNAFIGKLMKFEDYFRFLNSFRTSLRILKLLN